MALDAGLPNVPVHDLAIQERESDLVAGTHGRSVWVLDIEALQALDATIRDSDLHLFEGDEIQASRGWRGRRSRWFYRSEDNPRERFHYWSKDSAAVEVRVLDNENRLLRSFSADASAGVNFFEWDLMLDEELALAAEEARVAALSEEDAAGTLADRPWAEAVRLEWPLYVTGGDYVLELVREGAETVRADIVVKAPKERESRETAPAVRPRRSGP